MLGRNGKMRDRRANIVRLLGMFIIPACSLFLFIANAQRTDWRARIDEKVQWADSLSLKSQKIFYLNKFLKDKRPLRRLGTILLQDGKIIIFEVKYVTRFD